MLEIKERRGADDQIPAEGVTIGDAARRTGVSVHTLRYYERAGLVVSAADRTAGGRRRYHRTEEIERKIDIYRGRMAAVDADTLRRPPADQGRPVTRRCCIDVTSGIFGGSPACSHDARVALRHGGTEV